MLLVSYSVWRGNERSGARVPRGRKIGRGRVGTRRALRRPRDCPCGEPGIPAFSRQRGHPLPSPVRGRQDTGVNSMRTTPHLQAKVRVFGLQDRRHRARPRRHGRFRHPRQRAGRERILGFPHRGSRRLRQRRRRLSTTTCSMAASAPMTVSRFGAAAGYDIQMDRFVFAGEGEFIESTIDRRIRRTAAPARHARPSRSPRRSPRSTTSRAAATSPSAAARAMSSRRTFLLYGKLGYSWHKLAIEGARAPTTASPFTHSTSRSISPACASAPAAR